MLNRFKYIATIFLLLGSLPAAAETAFLAGEMKSAPAKGKVVVPVTPGEKVILEAGYFTIHDDGTLETQPDPEGGSYEWHVKCGKSAASCPKDEFEIAGHGRSYEVPSGPAKVIHVIVAHYSADGAQDEGAELLLQVGTGALAVAGPATILATSPPERHFSRHPHAESSFESSATESFGGEPSGHHGGGHHHGGAVSSGGFGRSSGGSSGGSSDSSDFSSSSSGSSLRRKRGSRSAMDSAFESYYSDQGGGGYSSGNGGGGPNTSARGYNRDSSTAVLSCANVPTANGGMRVVCEDETKELRVHEEEPPPKTAAVKVVAATKDGKKKFKKAPPKQAKSAKKKLRA
jgi:hypothetical protein